LTNFGILCIIVTEKVFLFVIIVHSMKLPEHYKNLDINQKRVIVANLISQFGNKKIQEMIDGFTEEQIVFLFTYFFTESKEARERMRDNMQKKYEATLKEIERIAEQIQLLNIQYREFLSQKKDIEKFLKK